MNAVVAVVASFERWQEDMPLPSANPNAIPAFKRAAETYTSLTGEQSGFDTVNLRIGTIWGPLGDPDSPFFPVPRLINAAVRGEDPDLTPPRPAGYAVQRGIADYLDSLTNGNPR